MSELGMGKKRRPVVTVTRKGQVTVPKLIRERLRIEEGDKIIFDINDRGEVIIKKAVLAAFDELARQISTEATRIGYTEEELAKDLRQARDEAWERFYGTRTKEKD